MWTRIAAILIRQRLLLLLLLGVGTAFMGGQIPNLKLQYEFGGLLPESDSTAIDYERFKKIFGTEGNVMLIGSDLDPLAIAPRRFGLGSISRVHSDHGCPPRHHR